MAANCLMVEPGAEDATTLRPMVERKNARVSGSKPLRRSSFVTKNSSHSSAAMPAKAMATERMYSLSTFISSCSSVSAWNRVSRNSVAPGVTSLPALVRLEAWMTSCRWVMGSRYISMPPRLMVSLMVIAAMLVRSPLTNTPPREPTSEMDQLPSS